MRHKELKVVEIPKWGDYLRGQWRQYFAKHLTNEEQKLIGMDGFLWHLCSWEKANCLEKEEAIAAFKKQSKTKCTIFYQFINEAYLLNDAKMLTVDELPYIRNHMYYGDLYVMDWNFKWTFIMTHESDCGPYFLQIT
ncbi:DUF4275 family protein [Domibacillus tundrae]|uniref:DUF4275 family protein n=1 Tax=Domibacillus tundrae TaxID=1587527 RepID=UPI000617F914|nr:DUF4275 family protein [Domibacillus tundrae]